MTCLSISFVYVAPLAAGGGAMLRAMWRQHLSKSINILHSKCLPEVKVQKVLSKYKK